MKMVNLAIAIVVASIIGVIIYSTGFAIPNLHATLDIRNSTHPSNQTVIPLELSSGETIVESTNLQNPSIQESLQQKQQ